MLNAASQAGRAVAQLPLKYLPLMLDSRVPATPAILLTVLAVLEASVLTLCSVFFTSVDVGNLPGEIKILHFKFQGHID